MFLQFFVHIFIITLIFWRDLQYVLEKRLDALAERQRILAKMKDLFAGTDYEKFAFQIANLVILSEGSKVLYLNSLKSFGRKIGTEVYRTIKNSTDAHNNVVAYL